MKGNEMPQRPKVRSLEKARARQEANGNLTATIAELQGSIPALNQLMEQSIPICTAHRIGKVVRSVNAEMEQYRVTVRALGERLANKDAEGKPITMEADTAKELPERFDISAENEAEGEKEIATLRAMDVQIPGQKIKLSDLVSVKMAPGLIMQLDWLIAEA